MKRFGWFVLGWNVLTIVGGAVVRATGSGAGCGRSWPSCQGTLVPELSGATVIEFAHRLVSGVALLLVAALVIGVFRTFPTGHPARRGAVLSGVAIVGEALIGAMIVFYEWVAHDASVARAISVPMHLVNTLFLLASLTLTVFWIGGGRRLQGVPATFRWIAAGMVVIAATGAVTALADTLFPKDGFSFLNDGVNLITRLRILHPIVAVLVGTAAAVYAWRLSTPSPARTVVMTSVTAQILGGAINVVLLTPLWLSLLHLVVADLLWISWIWLMATSASSQSAGAK